MDDLQLKIAINCIPRIGPLLARRLVSYAGSVEAVFKEKKRNLEKIPGIGSVKAAGFDPAKLLKEAEAECDYIKKHKLTALFYLDPDFPYRLRECEDGPLLIYVKGNASFNTKKVVSVVGTRKATARGRAVVEEIIGYLAGRHPDLLLVSGLAYGIDIMAHKAALTNKIETVAALGHGFCYMYPPDHNKYAGQIIRQGAVVTEFQSYRKPEAGNFVSRNRIIAGLADACVIIESAEKGGALITADLANSYNRDVFAVPGRNNDVYSRGCNQLIKTNRAALIENGSDIEQAMGWSRECAGKDTQQQLSFQELSPEERAVLKYLDDNGESSLDQMSISLNLPLSRLSGLLLKMEFRGLIHPLPGKYFRRN